eukprot:XP_011674712.1 PREDICTED: uncharacterized protein LOC105443356 [Strongylocentrotus purpuratus]
MNKKIFVRIAEFLDLERLENENTNLLRKPDAFLFELVEKIDCKTNYNKLGTRLVTMAKAQYFLGPTASYADALFTCMIRWREANGTSTDSYTKFRGILMNVGLVEQAEQMDKLEEGEGQDDVDLPSVPGSPTNATHPELEACV